MSEHKLCSQSYLVNVAIDVPIYREFTYIYNQPLEPGTKVSVQFINKVICGFVINCTQDFSTLNIDPNKLKPIMSVWDDIFTIPNDVIKLAKFVSKYYHYPFGQTIFATIPPYLRSNLLPKRVINLELKNIIKKIKNNKFIQKITLNQEQQYIVDAITSNINTFYPTLIHGITGSGKTEVYLELISKVLGLGKQALILVPEINLTPQLLDRFNNRFDGYNIQILHSTISNKSRFISWKNSQLGKIDIIIATRLGIFTPFKNLGIIVIDEEHDISFKQSDNLRYNARDVGLYRAKQLNIPIILGSATPSLETLYNQQQNRLQLFMLNSRGVTSSQLPQIKLIDLNHEKHYQELSITAINHINQCLQKKEMVLIYLNRRGYSPIIACYECDWISTCKNCSTKLVYHFTNNKRYLKCHHCGYNCNVPIACPKCNNPYLQTLGQGTQKLEENLFNLFPNARITRVDQDTTNNKQAWHDLYEKVHSNQVDILLGTQMLAKGHDFHNITLVVAINIDCGLFNYDFRASETMYQQLTQVSGRAGRGKKSGIVLLHTHYPKHELYQYLINHDFNSATNYLMNQRKQINLPPFAYIALIKASHKKIITVMEYLQTVYSKLQNFKLNSTIIYPPVPSIIQKLKNRERGQIFIQSNDRNELHNILNYITQNLIKTIGDMNIIIDVDPYEL